MELAELKKINADQAEIRIWHEKINETDPLQIKEVMDLMKNNPEYRKFIIDYSRG